MIGCNFDFQQKRFCLTFLPQSIRIRIFLKYFCFGRNFRLPSFKTTTTQKKKKNTNYEIIKNQNQNNMLHKFLVFKNCTNRVTAVRYYRDFDKLTTTTTKYSLQNNSVFYIPSKHYHHPQQCVRLAARIQSQLNARCYQTFQLNWPRNYCTKRDMKKIDRSWSSLRKQHKQSKREIKRLFSLAKDEKWYLIAAVGCLVVSSAITMGVPRAIGKLMDMIVLDNFPKDKLHAFCFLLFGIFAIGGLANFGRIYLMNSASKWTIEIDSTQNPMVFFFVVSITYCEGFAIAFVSDDVKPRARLV